MAARLKKSSRVPRRGHILDVAAKVLAERGYRDTTMLEIARRSSASKETLYAWFGDKLGLFEAVVRRNAVRVRVALNGHLDRDTPVETTLAAFGYALATHVLCDNAVAISRAAIAEASSGSVLAGSLTRVGREPIRRTLVGYLEQCRARGLLNVEDYDDAVDTFVGLLLGDVQTRRLLGIVAAPCEADVEDRAKRAAEQFLRLYRN